MGRCQECGESFSGRVDKKFCCDDCRNSYHNRKSRTENIAMRRINRILKNNYLIICEIIKSQGGQECGIINVCVENLVRRGFNFYYFTSLNEEDPGGICYYCYDIPYKISDKKILTIYNYKINN